MSRGGDTQFRKGQSGNPAGRPKKRRSHVSAFDIIFDKTLTVTQGGVERELTVDEALQLQTYQAALKGNRAAIRTVLKMIDKREAALARHNPPPVRQVRVEYEHDADNACEAMRILDIAGYQMALPGADPARRTMKLTTWAAQAGLSRPGRRQLSERDVDEIRLFTFEASKLKWPRGRAT